MRLCVCKGLLERRPPQPLFPARGSRKELQGDAARSLKIQDPELMRAGIQVHLCRLALWWMSTIVVDHQLAVDPQYRSIIGV